LELLVDIKPIDGTCDTKMNLTLEPLQIVYSKTCLEHLGHFFTPDSGEGGLENMVLAANKRAKEYSDAQLAAVNAAIEAHTTLLLDIKIDAPIVILPENPNAIHSKGIVADLGKFELYTSPQVEVLEDEGEEKVTENAETKGETNTTAVVVDVSAQEDQTTNANDFQRRNVGDLNNMELEKKYDHFYFVGQAIAIRVGTLDLTERQQDNENTKKYRRASFVSDNAIQNALQPAKTGDGGGGVDSSSSSASTTKLSEEEMKNMFQQVKKRTRTRTSTQHFHLPPLQQRNVQHHGSSFFFDVVLHVVRPRPNHPRPTTHFFVY
jgi:hypothetical protein